MNIMFAVDGFFVRIRDKAGRVKVTVWSNCGDKLASDFISADPHMSFWRTIEQVSNDVVVGAIREKLQF